MSLIDSSYFVGDLFIPNLEGNHPVALQNLTTLNQVITTYEKNYLVKLLGPTLYGEFITALTTSETWATELQAELVDSVDKTSPIAYYVFYWWYRNQISMITNQGESESKSENSINVSPGLRLQMAYNRAIDLTYDVVDYMDDAVNLPSDPVTDPYLLYKVNHFNI